MTHLRRDLMAVSHMPARKRKDNTFYKTDQMRSSMDEIMYDRDYDQSRSAPKFNEQVAFDDRLKRVSPIRAQTTAQTTAFGVQLRAPERLPERPPEVLPFQRSLSSIRLTR